MWRFISPPIYPLYNLLSSSVAAPLLSGWILSPRRSSWSSRADCDGPCGRLFQIAVVCSDSRLRLGMRSACTSGLNSSWASVFDEHICQDKLRVASIFCSYVFSATSYSATVTQVSSLGINVEQIRLSASVLMEVLSIWADLLAQISFQLRCCLSFWREGHSANPWTGVWRAPSAEWLLINSVFPAFSFPTLLGPVWQRFLKDVCPILPVSRDCQKAHLHKISTNIRVSGPDFGFFLEDTLFIFWFILTGVQVSLLHFFLTFKIANFCFCFHLRFGAWSVPPPRPCGLGRIMSRQWFSLRRYAYLLLPLWAGWAGRPWCWLPDKEQAGQSEDSQHWS